MKALASAADEPGGGERTGLSGCRAVLFDFGGTLDSDGEHWLDRFYRIYASAGLDQPRAEIKRVFYEADAACGRDPRVAAMGLRALMRCHIRLQFAMLGLNRPEKEREMTALFCAPAEGILRRNARLLRRLSRSFRLGVVSNFYGNVETLCCEAGLEPSLSVILDSARIGTAKPQPEIFRLALVALGCEPGETVFVGDSYERDMLPARRLGMKAVWLPGPRPRVPAGAEPVDAVISHLPQLEGLLR